VGCQREVQGDPINDFHHGLAVLSYPMEPTRGAEERGGVGQSERRSTSFRGGRVAIERTTRIERIPDPDSDFDVGQGALKK
jgi:hypothetical protein